MNLAIISSKSKIIMVFNISALFFLGLELGTHLFVKVPRPGASEAGTQSNHSKVEAIPLSALPKDTTSELAGLAPH